MPNTLITPWSKPTTQHHWFVAPADDKKDYHLTRRYRQTILDRHIVWGSRYSPTWSYWGPPGLGAAFISYMTVNRAYRPWWMNFWYFPATYFLLLTVVRFNREFYFEYQIHKILTWGQHELGQAKRRIQGGKETALHVSERRGVEDRDGYWDHRAGSI
eukprot:TRINITY_DN30356_c0_g1_i1.p1 TRINITY_DN30356_c0_g1~~TRINITY_DN30356_c0_g1_i1.p1  ORF type:complete len:158 (+),score=5.84 TRINITY_DN30356_c0_g1_i1:45-518(+)